MKGRVLRFIHVPKAVRNEWKRVDPVNAPYYAVSSTQVVGARGAAVTAAHGTLAGATTAINALISRLSAAAGGHGLIA